MRRTFGLPGRWRFAADDVVLAVSTVMALGVVVFVLQLTWEQLVAGWGAIILVAAIALISWRLIAAAARSSDITGLGPWLVGSLVVKLIGTFARYLVGREVYGSGDVVEYSGIGRYLAASIHQGVWTLQGTAIGNRPAGTQSVGWVIGTIYAFVGTSPMLGYLVFGWLSWVGLMLFYRAYCTAFPDLRSKGFALCIFVLPSLVYWSSSIGKESLMLFLLGLTTFGFARVFTSSGTLRGLVMIAAGMAGIAWIRPHVALLLLGSAAVAVLMIHPAGVHGRSLVVRGVLIAFVIPMLVVSMSRTENLFGGQEKGSTGTINSSLAETQERTSQGGSAFEAQPVRSPADLPLATVSVLLRPYPWQATSGPVFVASLEGLFLVGLLVVYGRSMLRLPALAWRRPMVAFSLGYVVLFIVAFSNVGNAGILARQRSQVIPFLLLATCAAAAKPLESSRGDRASGGSSDDGRSSTSPAPSTSPMVSNA